MDDEAMKAMARRICARISPTYDSKDIAVAIAAIIETQEMIAAWLEQYPSPMNDLDMAMRIREICAAIRSGQQFRKDV